MNEILYGGLLLAAIGFSVAVWAMLRCCSDEYEIRTSEVRTTHGQS
jgi:hypothetical protein